MRSTTIVHVSGHIQISWYEQCLGYRDDLPHAVAGIVGGRRVLVFDVVRRLGAGPVAQWESVRFTRGRSLVRSQPGPPGHSAIGPRRATSVQYRAVVILLSIGRFGLSIWRSGCARKQASSRRTDGIVLSLAMKFGRGLLITAVAAAAIGAGIASAPPASAGCLAIDPENTYCDDPVAPDGTWHRCHQKSLIVYQGSWVWKRMPPTTSCYRVDPSQSWAPTPVGQPQFHIDD